MRFTLIGYFRKIKIEGKEKIPKKGPKIFIANHPSAFMDPIVVAVNLKPKVYFLAGGEYLGKGLRYWFMNRFLNIIPIYRPEKMPEKSHKNPAIFENCIAHLNRGKSILVFPEGVSSKEKKVLPLRTGVARIVRATEVSNKLKTGIQIIPIGLNYSDPHKFRSDLFIKVGEPILAVNFLSADSDKEIEEVNVLTQKMEEALIKTVLHVENDEFEDLLAKIGDSYMRDLKSKLGVEYADQQGEFELNQSFISAFTFFRENSPEEFEKINQKIDDYFKLLNSHQIKDQHLRKLNSTSTVAQKFFLIFGAVFFLIGYLTNVIPYELSKLIQKKFNVQDTFKGSIYMTAGMLVFLAWFAACTVILWKFTSLGILTLFTPIVLYPFGIFALVYKSVYHYLNERRKLRDFLDSDNELKDELLSKRSKLMGDFEMLRTKFNEAT
jgi:glycerol-3-phosphate O-acyltransferase / dihydroxyacetone phosphate acyltransferase